MRAGCGFTDSSIVSLLGSVRRFAVASMRIAGKVGMGTAATLRHHFRKAFRTSPTAYRKRFTTVPLKRQS